MRPSTLLLDRAGAVATVTLNRPDVLNSFDATMMREAQEAFRGLAADPTCRAIVLTGAGRGFCAGQDLALARPGEDFRLEPDFLREGYNTLVTIMREAPQPIVAAVNGVAAGAGANLALACDLVLASDAASFVQAFVKIGLIPDCGGTYFLPRLVGWQRAAALSMLGEKLTAEKAEQWGLVWEVCPSSVLLEKAQALAGRLAQLPTRAIALTKRALDASAANDYRAQLELEAVLQGEAGRTRDFQEGVQAFLAKRPAHFEGR